MILIKITEKGEKGAWHNKYVDNLFLATPNGDDFAINFLSNLDSDKLNNFSGKYIPRSSCLVMQKPKQFGVTGIVNK